MRRRRAAAADGSQASMTSPDTKGSEKKTLLPKSEKQRRSLPLSRLLVLLLPVVITAGLLVARRRTVTDLPKAYAICSKRGRFSVRTLDAADSIAECLVVDDGVVADIGSLKAIRSRWRDKQTVGGPGAIPFHFLSSSEHTVFPGLIDAHAHVLQFGEAQSAVDLTGSLSTEEVVERIAQYIQNDPELERDRSRFILGLGWDQTKFPSKEFPTAADLDRDPRLKGRPIYLKRIDVHALWVSENILSRLPRALPDHVDGGIIIRDSDNRPTGIFVDNAQAFVLKVIPPATDAQKRKSLAATAKKMLETGLTGVHDASLSLDDVAFLKKLDQQGALPVRIWGMVYCDPINTYCGDRVQPYEGTHFTVRAVKLFADGALGSWGAAMHEPYSDKPGEHGLLLSNESVFEPLARKWVNKGFSVCSHAIGDKANTLILDAYERVLADHSGEDLRLRIEHAQIMRPTDIERAGRLGVISSVQPTHATSDMGYAEARLGPERIKGAYAWQSLTKSGSPVVLGSDFPVESVDPLLGIYAAVTRLWTNGDSPHGRDGWYPEERLTRAQALRGFTNGPAYASFQESRVGSLEVGKRADMVIFDRDLLHCSSQELLEAKVVATIVDGKLLYGKLR